MGLKSRIRRQERRVAPAVDCLFDAGDLVTRQVVHDLITRYQGGNGTARPKATPFIGPCIGAVRPSRRRLGGEGSCLPSPCGTAAPALATLYLGRGAGSISRRRDRVGFSSQASRRAATSGRSCSAACVGGSHGDRRTATPCRSRDSALSAAPAARRVFPASSTLASKNAAAPSIRPDRRSPPLG